jgi:hypothetical protein
MGMANSGTAHIGGGAGAGKVSVQDLTLTKYVDSSSEWHEDKEHLGRFIAPEGLEDSAQGFNPGNRLTRATRPERAPDQT